MTSAATVSTGELTVTLSESLPSSASTAVGDWTAIDATLEPDVTAMILTADVSGSTVTITYRTVEDTSFAPVLTYTGAGLADAGRNAVPSGAQVTATDGVAPTAMATFLGSTLTITFSEPVNGVSDMPLTLTRPNGSTTTQAFTHDDGDRTATLRMPSTPATGTWGIAIPAAVTDVTGNARDVDSANISADASIAPMATAISYTVFEPGGTTPRAAPYTNYARAGDVIEVSVTLDESVSGAPTILFVGQTASPTPMTRVGMTDEWTARYTVEAGTTDIGFTFVMSVTGAVSGAMDEIRETTLSVTPPAIDRTVPTISAQTAALDEVTVSFSEDVSGTTEATEWTVGGTAAESITSDGSAQTGDLALSDERTFTLGLSQAGELAGGEARPTVAFTARTTPALHDVAGNPLDTSSITAIDRIRPSLVSMEFTAPNMITVTLSEPLDANTLGSSIPQASLSPHLGGITVNYAIGAESLTLRTVNSAAERASHSLTLPARVTDVANPAGVSRKRHLAGRSGRHAAGHHAADVHRAHVQRLARHRDVQRARSGHDGGLRVDT